MRKLRKAIGTILLIVLIAPVLILARPATVMEPVVRYFPSRIEYIEHRYVPLFEVARMWIEGPLTHFERTVPFVYFGLYVLSIWLIRYKGRERLRAKEEQL